jgi:CubicO group peptidase (beta-lactamase class C family)
MIMKRIFLLFFIAANCSAYSQSDMISCFDKMVAATYKSTEPGCVALVARGDSILYKKAIGLADLELNVAMKTEMVFYIGSITKEFTAVCVLQLWEQGKLNPDDEIIKYLPDFPVNGRKITIENLLTHTSGIIDAPGSNALSDQGKTNETPEEMMREIMKQPIAFDPDTKMIYSNAGYEILGYIIEKVSGITYSDYLQKNIFIPAGMLHTYYGESSNVIPNRAHAYLKGKSGFVNFWPGRTPFSAGTILSSAEDLLKWNLALQSGRLLKKETLAKAITSYKLIDGTETGYGYGFQVGDIQGSPDIEHSGLMGGYTSDALYLRQEKLFVVVLSNLRGPSSEALAGNLAALAIGKPFPSEAITLDTTLRNTYTGIYQDSAAVKRRVTLENEKLVYQKVDGGPKFIMMPYAKDKFFFPNTSMMAEIRRNNDQTISGLVVFDRRRPAAPVNILKRIFPESIIR